MKPITIHGVLVHILGSGCLITGKSGCGKSELALALIDRGHQLVSDDAVELYLENNNIYGKAPKLLANLLEIKNIGIINVLHHFGPQAIKASSRLDLIIKLEDDLPNQVDNLTFMMTQRELLNTNIATYQLNADSTRPLALLAESLVREHHLQQQGLNAANDFKIAHNQELRRGTS